MKLIIGLGNPGKEHANTRHNAGFLALDALAKELGLEWRKDAKRNAEVAKGDMDGEPVILAKPLTFMNLSGDAVAALASYNKVKPEDVLVIHDDLDLAPGTVKFKKGGGTAGHHGLDSIVERLGTGDFSRIRIGIGKPEHKTETESWVLGKMDAVPRLDDFQKFLQR